jgi:DNA-binding NtrC family response regulator
MVKQPRILIVDDDKNIRSVFKVNLENNGYEVDTAENGKEAIEKSRERFYNIALIDIKLSDMQGTNLLTILREVAPRMKKIIITGFPSLQNAINALNEGADGYLLKPVSMDHLFKTIEEQLRRQREEEKYSEKKVEEFIETRAKELESLLKYHNPI